MSRTGSTTSRASRATGRIVQRLKPLYGPSQPPRVLDPLGELIFTILSQSTADTNSVPAFEALVARFDGDWEAVRRARVSSIAAAIRRAGLANQKAPRIKALLDALPRPAGRPTLDLASMSDEEAVAYLTSFDGVGLKTAACVLLFACGRPVLPVDTHVHRVSQRLGLIGPKVTPLAAHALLQSQVADRDVLDFHVLLVKHGRACCRARKPRCTACPLLELCPTGPALLAAGQTAEVIDLPAPAASSIEQVHVPPARSAARRRRSGR